MNIMVIDAKKATSRGMTKVTYYCVLLCTLWGTVVKSQIPTWLNETCLDGLALPKFNELAVVYDISNGSGLCHVGVGDIANGSTGSDGTVVCSSCQPVVELCASFVGDLNRAVENQCELATTPTQACHRATVSYKAYGYGLVMLVVVLMLTTLMSLVLAKLGQQLKGRSSGGGGGGDLSYKLLNLGLTALGASALLDNVVLHIVPEIFDVSASSSIVLGKGCVMLLGLYAFYLLEFVLHSFTGHSHSHGGDGGDGDGDGGHDDLNREVTLPHGSCKDDEAGATIVHPRRGRDEDCTQQKYGSVTSSAPQPDEVKVEQKDRERTSLYQRLGAVRYSAERPNGDSDVDTSPLFDHGHSHGGGHWRSSPFLLLMVADTLHMLADGVALGASISQSLTLGLTTSLALLLHELLHMFGDYSILLRMKGGLLRTVLPFIAYMYLMACIGYIIGASIGLHCTEANKWVLSLAAGFFIYVALVNLLPELINGVPRGLIRLAAILVIGLCFLVTFAIFIVFAVYQSSISVPI